MFGDEVIKVGDFIGIKLLLKVINSVLDHAGQLGVEPAVRHDEPVVVVVDIKRGIELLFNLY